MSIIIKGITKDKFATLMIGEDVIKRYPDVIDGCDYFYGHEVWDIPPHGRLIDADAYLEKLMDTVNECVKKGVEIEAFRSFIEGAEVALVDAMTMLNNMPTIIEAEVEGK